MGAEGQGLHYARGNGINNTIIELRGESALLSLSLSTLVYYPSIGYTESDTLVVSVAELECGGVFTVIVNRRVIVQILF